MHSQNIAVETPTNGKVSKKAVDQHHIRFASPVRKQQKKLQPLYSPGGNASKGVPYRTFTRYSDVKPYASIHCNHTLSNFFWQFLLNLYNGKTESTAAIQVLTVGWVGCFQLSRICLLA